MKVYGHPVSVTTRQVLALIAEKGVAAELIPVDVLAREQIGAPHRSRHPFGKIPVLEEDDGFRLYEAQAILRYLDGHLAGPSFTPADLRERAAMEQWLSAEHAYFQPAMKKIFARGYAGMMGLEDPGPRVPEEGLGELRETLDILDARLRGAPFLAGAAMSLADLCWVAGLVHVAKAQMRDEIEARPTLDAWWRRGVERPAWSGLMTGFGLDPYSG